MNWMTHPIPRFFGRHYIPIRNSHLIRYHHRRSNFPLDHYVGKFFSGLLHVSWMKKKGYIRGSNPDTGAPSVPEIEISSSPIDATRSRGCNFKFIVSAGFFLSFHTLTFCKLVSQIYLLRDHWLALSFVSASRNV